MGNSTESETQAIRFPMRPDVDTEVFIFDTSSLVELKHVSREAREVAKEAMNFLAKDGRLLFPTTVLKELSAYQGKNDLPMRWADKHRGDCLKDPIMTTVASVMASVPDVIDSEKVSGEEEADPYVLALGMDVRSDGLDPVVVSEERNDKHRLSMHTACGLLRLHKLDLRSFVRDRAGRTSAATSMHSTAQD